MRKVYTLLLVLASLLALRFLSEPMSAKKQVPESETAGKESLPVYSLGAQALITKAFQDIDPNLLIDYHTHILGVGENNSGNFVHPDMLSLWHPIKHLKFRVYAQAGGIENTDHSDSEYLNRLVKLIRSMPAHGKYAILAFDKNYHEDGTANLEKTEFYVSNAYVFQVAKQYPDLFIPVMSVHPYRKDALEELELWAAQGGRMVKWLPNAMGMDPASKLCDAFYEKMKSLNLILLTHAGEEQAVDAEEDQILGNPERLRRPLDAGVKVIVAHCASLGEGSYTDSTGQTRVSSNFQLFLKLLREKKYAGRIYGDISALTQFNRSGEPLEALLDSLQFHGQLLNGSDYPLPAVDIIIRTRQLQQHGYITKEERKYLNEIFEQNPLLFDFVLKRILHSPKGKNQFSSNIFSRNVF